jgi:hypothetical protein
MSKRAWAGLIGSLFVDATRMFAEIRHRSPLSDVNPRLTMTTSTTRLSLDDVRFAPESGPPISD